MASDVVVWLGWIVFPGSLPASVTKNRGQGRDKHSGPGQTCPFKLAQDLLSISLCASHKDFARKTEPCFLSELILEKQTILLQINYYETISSKISISKELCMAL